METKEFDWSATRQLSVVQILLAFILPSAVAYTGFRIVLPMLVDRGVPSMIAWPSIASVMLLILVTMAFIFLRLEAIELNISLASRMCLKRLSMRQWGKYFVIIVIGLIIVGGAAQLVIPFMNMTGITIPHYMPFFLNPGINPMEIDSSILSPGYPLEGKFILLPLIGITLLLNILAEELYFRAWLLPKMSQYGSMAWIINGVFFALYHTFQFWLLPTILVGSLLMTFVIYNSKSVWPAFVVHFLGNFLFAVLSLLFLILN